MNQLEAVNTLLEIIGEAPINTLRETGNVDVSMAKTMINNVSTSIQAKGYNFNSETITLQPDENKHILIPPNVIRIDAVNKNIPVVFRQGMLYTKGVGFEFEGPLPVNILWRLDFDDMPEAARQYVAIVAARKFQIRILGSDSVQRFTAEEEMEALVTLNEWETDTGDYNLLDAPDMLGYRRSA